MSKWEQTGESNEWYTPKYIFDALECRFDIDVASPVDRTFCSVPADRFIESGSLELQWNGFVWCNPPFGGRNGILLWINKMNTERLGIFLTPDRTSAPWWKVVAKGSDSVLFLSKKVKFIRPDGTTGDSPSTGTCLFGYSAPATHALRTAERNKLGVFYRR
jgi:hypothetical protein